MKRNALPLLAAFLWLASLNAFADVITLKDGRQITGSVESGNTREIRVKSAEASQAVSIDQIGRIDFDAPDVWASQPLISAAPKQVTLPIGTEISVRTVDVIDSKSADLYKEYAASLDDPVVVGGIVVASANVNAILRVTQITKGKLVPHRQAALSLCLIALVINGRRVDVHTQALDSQSVSHVKRDAIAGAAGGAAVGAVAGGGMGAAMGAAAGAAGGVVFDTVTGHVKISSETRYSFTLAEPVTILAQAGAR